MFRIIKAAIILGVLFYLYCCVDSAQRRIAASYSWMRPSKPLL